MKNRLIFTSIKDEDERLPLWLSYYSQFFNDIVIVDHMSVGDSIEKAKKVYKFEHIIDNDVIETQEDGRAIDSEHDAVCMMEYQKRFLKTHKWVLYAHADEYVVPDPLKYKDLGDYIDKCEKDYVFCTGRSALHYPDSEKDMAWDKPILKQRTWWWNDNYASHKPLLSRVPLEWTPGYHSLRSISDEEKRDSDKKICDPYLYLIHLYQVDLKTYKSKNRHSWDLGWFNKGKDNKTKEKIPLRFKKML